MSNNHKIPVEYAKYAFYYIIKIWSLVINYFKKSPSVSGVAVIIVAFQAADPGSTPG